MDGRRESVRERWRETWKEEEEEEVTRWKLKGPSSNIVVVERWEECIWSIQCRHYAATIAAAAAAVAAAAAKRNQIHNNRAWRIWNQWEFLIYDFKINSPLRSTPSLSTFHAHTLSLYLCGPQTSKWDWKVCAKDFWLSRINLVYRLTWAVC